MRTTLGQLVSELVDAYERIYQDHELATVATSVTLEQIMHDAAASKALDSEPTERIRRLR
jgi:hypothetical protein